MVRPFPTAVEVAIVGSGPAGATYARVLSELVPGATIAMFEVGPLLADPPGLHVKNIGDPLQRALAQRRSEGPYPHTAADEDAVASYSDPAERVVRAGTYLLPEDYQLDGEDGLPAAAMSSNVGGMGAHWTGACPRPGESELIDFVAELEQLLDEGERLLHVSRNPFETAPYSDVVRDRLSAALDDSRSPTRTVRPMPLAVRRQPDGTLAWTGPDVIFGAETRANENFTLIPEALVTAVVVEDDRATGVQVRDLTDGTSRVVRARFVVVAADALRTPQVLFASGVRPPALGRYLNDQPQVLYAVRLNDVEPAAGEQVTVGSPVIAEESGVTWVPFTDEAPFHGQVMQFDTSPIPLADDDVPVPGTMVGLGWFCAKDLQENDRVEFDDQASDAYGMPKMRLHYRLTDLDRASIAAACSAIEEAGRALGDPLDEKPIVLSPGASLHYQGTTRMGAVDDGTSVCGPTSQVWGVEGLYVAGNGVIPTPTACNPTLTAVALGVAGARDIVRRLQA